MYDLRGRSIAILRGSYEAKPRKIEFMKKIELVRKFVKNKFDEEDWKYHILLVVFYAKKLAKHYKVNMETVETVELAALLHDIGRTDQKNDDMHHVVGVPVAETILKKFHYSEKTIEEVKHCILSHRTSTGPKPKTMVAKIVANADAMAHFDAIPVLIYWRAVNRGNLETILQWINNKIQKDWDKKINLPEAKRIAKNKYKAAKLILKSMR